MIVRNDSLTVTNTRIVTLIRNEKQTNMQKNESRNDRYETFCKK